MSADRSASTEANALAACCAVLLFEPHAAMPPSKAATAAAIYRGIKPDDGEEHPGKHETAAHHGNPRDQDQFATALNLCSEVFDALLKAHDLVMWVTRSVAIQARRSQGPAHASI
jgi:hypothetical protein